MMNRKQRFFGGVNLRPETDFPTSPSKGDLCFRQGALFIFTSIADLDSWVPVSKSTNFHVHNQATASAKWIVRYPFNTNKVSVTVWDGDNEITDALVRTKQDSESGEWYAEIDFVGGQTGYPVVFGDSSLDVLDANINNLDVQSSLRVGGEFVLTMLDKTELLGLISTALKSDDVVDALTSTQAGLPLSANQGRLLKEAIDGINAVLASDTTTLDEFQEVVDFITANRATLDALTISNIAGLQATLDDFTSRIGALETSVGSLTSALAGKLDSTAKAADTALFDGRPVSDFVLASDTVDMGEY